MKDTLTYIVSSIVDDPKSVAIEEDNSDPTTNHFIISVAKDDMGKIIGKGGKVIRAIRNVMKIPAIKQDKRVFITLNNEE